MITRKLVGDGRGTANLRVAFLASRHFVPNMMFQVQIQGLDIPRAGYKYSILIILIYLLSTNSILIQFSPYWFNRCALFVSICSFCLRSSHAVYDVSKNKTHQEPHSLESDAVRPGREISPLDRWALKEKSTRGDADLECEEEPKGKCGAGWHAKC